MGLCRCGVLQGQECPPICGWDRIERLKEEGLDAVADMQASEVMAVRELVAKSMVENGLLPGAGWSIGERVKWDTRSIDHEFWPVRNARVGELPEEERRDLGMTYRRLL